MPVRLLIVDDELVIRKLLERHFTSKGYDVTTAENGRVALDRLNEAKFDIVVTDMLMPEMDGIELLKRVREEFPLIRVILMTGATSMSTMLTCLRDGAFTFITKPLDELQPLEDAVHVAAWLVQGWMEQFAIMRKIRAQAEVHP